MKTISRISPLQLGKVIAVMYGLLSAIFIPFLWIAMATSPHGKGLGVFSIVMPVFYIICGFIGGLIGAFVYNICAKWVGGIEIELED